MSIDQTNKEFQGYFALVAIQYGWDKANEMIFGIVSVPKPTTDTHVCRTCKLEIPNPGIENAVFDVDGYITDELECMDCQIKWHNENGDFNYSTTDGRKLLCFIRECRGMAGEPMSYIEFKVNDTDLGNSEIDTDKATSLLNEEDAADLKQLLENMWDENHRSALRWIE